MRTHSVLLSSFIIISACYLLFATVVTARAQTLPSVSGSPILNGESLDTFVIDGRQKELATREIVDVKGQPFTKAIRVTTEPGASTEWNAQLQAVPQASIEKGDVLLARFWMRCVESMTDEGFTGFIYEIAHPDFDKAAEVRLSTGKQWRQCFVPFRAPRDFPADQSRICFRVGYDRQIIEIGGINITNFGKSVKLEDLPRTRADYSGRSPEAAWRKEARERIEKFRKGNLTIRVTDSAGKPVDGASAQVSMKRHAFGFGSCVDMNFLLGDTPDLQRYRETFEKYFNRAVFENDMKWPAVYNSIPPKLDQAVEWLAARNIQIRGHNLFWPGWRWLPRELREYENQPAELRRIAEKRATEMTAHFRGKLIHWDVVNEPYSNHDLIDLLGGREVMIDWFKLAHQADPECKLFLNDFGILEGGPRGEHARHFYDTIKFLQESGAPVN